MLCPACLQYVLWLSDTPWRLFILCVHEMSTRFLILSIYVLFVPNVLKGSYLLIFSVYGLVIKLPQYSNVWLKSLFLLWGNWNIYCYVRGLISNIISVLLSLFIMEFTYILLLSIAFWRHLTPFLCNFVYCAYFFSLLL